jgi:hypothetical protein
MNGLTDTTGPGAASAGRWRRILTAGMAALSLVLVLSGPLAGKAYAADDDDDDESIETKFIKKFLGVNNRDSIDYKERPPLVVPPNLNNLPRPENNAVANSPAWPKNPEEVERKKRAAVQKNQRRRSHEEEGRALTPAELEGGRLAGAGRVQNPTGPQDAEADGRRMMRPGELGTKGNFLQNLLKDSSKPEVAEFKGEPSRSNLTQPPTGYQTPSAAHPYGLTPRQEKAKPYDLTRRGEGSQ